MYIDFAIFLDVSILENVQVKKFRLLKIAIEKGDKDISNLIKNKLELEKLEEQRDLDIEEYNNKINKIIQKYKNVLKSWEEIEKMIF